MKQCGIRKNIFLSKNVNSVVKCSEVKLNIYTIFYSFIMTLPLYNVL